MLIKVANERCVWKLSRFIVHSFEWYINQNGQNINWIITWVKNTWVGFNLCYSNKSKWQKFDFRMMKKYFTSLRLIFMGAITVMLLSFIQSGSKKEAYEAASKLYKNFNFQHHGLSTNCKWLKVASKSAWRKVTPCDQSPLLHHAVDILQYRAKKDCWQQISEGKSDKWFRESFWVVRCANSFSYENISILSQHVLDTSIIIAQLKLFPKS